MTKLETTTSFKPYVLFPEKKNRTSLSSNYSISSICRYLSEILGNLQHWNTIFDFPALDSKNSHAPKSSKKITSQAFTTNNISGIQHPFVASYAFSSSIKNLMMSKDGSVMFENLLKNWILYRKYHVIEEIVSNSTLLCIAAKDSFGVHSVMKLIEYVKKFNNLSAILASSFQENVLEIMNHPVAFQLVACCLPNLGYDHNMFLLNAASKHCVKLAKNRIGSDSLKQIISCSASCERENILLNIAYNSVYLAKHPKGNNVIQFVLEDLDNLPFNRYLHRCLEEHLMELATDQYGSYVIQKCIMSFGGESLIESLLLKFDLSKFERLATDAYGNYVFQTAIEKCRGTWLHYELEVALKQLPRELSTHAYASNVFKLIRTLKTK